MYERFLKRPLDAGLAAVGLLSVAPVLLAVALLVRFIDGSPIFFRQARPGRLGVTFKMIKFRTMRIRPPHSGHGSSDGERLTKLGSALRSMSIDELPELWNVLRGDMSLVGPRPLLVEYLDRYTSEQARRHEVRPGITGLAQISGRNALSWEDKFALDVWYVDHCSLWLDLKILARTVLTILSRRGINHVGYATAPEFRGASQEVGE